MHKSQKCTLALRLPVERTGAARGANTVLEASRGHSRLFGSTFLVGPAFRRVERCLPPLWLAWAAPAQREQPSLCFQHVFFFSPHSAEINSQDGILCRVCAHSTPNALGLGGHSEPQSGLWPLSSAPKSTRCRQSTQPSTWGDVKAQLCCWEECQYPVPKCLCLFGLLSTLIRCRYQLSALKTRERKRRQKRLPSALSPSHLKKVAIM